MAYVGQTRGRKMIARLEAAGIGECTQRDEFPPRRRPWFLDNAAFKDWKAGRAFDAAQWSEVLPRATAEGPDFVVAPDLVAQGWASLAFSINAVGAIRAAGGRAYLVTQDGMEADPRRVASEAITHGFSGLFVGGTLPWKRDTGAMWVKAAHAANLPCHIGRVGTIRRTRWAREIGADSIDSCLPLWRADRMLGWLSVLTEDQGRLFT